MASSEEIEKILSYARLIRPDEMFSNINPAKNGVKAVMRCLSDQKKPMTSGQLSDATHVSTARMAVLLKKMEEQKLIVRSTDPKDRRKTIVELSEHGWDLSDAMDERVCHIVEGLIDRMGMEKLEQLFALMKELHINMHELVSLELRDMDEKLGIGGDKSE